MFIFIIISYMLCVSEEKSFKLSLAIAMLLTVIINIKKLIIIYTALKIGIPIRKIVQYGITILGILVEVLHISMRFYLKKNVNDEI